VLDLRRLQALHALAQHGTIRAAADALHFTPAAVSQQLTALERETGTSLLVRTGRSIRLNEAGRTLAAHAEILLRQVSQAESALAAASGPTSGTVRLAAFPSAIATFVADAVGALRSTHPLIEVTVAEAEPEVAEPMLRANQVDLAVMHHYDLIPRSYPPGSPPILLLDEPMYVALPAAHALAGRRSISLRALRNEPWIVPAQALTCLELVERACGAAGFVPRPAARCTEYGAVLSLVGHGVGVALVPALALSTRSLDGVAVRTLARPIRRHTTAVVEPLAQASIAVSAVLEALVAAGARYATPIESVA
jgi:DNA-binding transcriptional LysR family regulator